MANVLIVDDDRDFLAATSDLMELLDHRVSTADSLAAAREALAASRHDLVLLDLLLPDGSGLALFDDIDWRDAPRVCVVTGSEGVGEGISTIMGPRVSFVMKPLEPAMLERLLEQVEGDLSEAPGGRELHFGFVVGESPAMQKIYRQIERVGRSRASVFVTGESGTGKEVIARAIHVKSELEGPFVALNCGAVTRELIGSELFGHEKGAFTGASSRRAGCFERARDGTLFLDEITEMPIDLQPNLLRVLETGEFVPIGGQKPLTTNCRVISASNADLSRVFAEGKLREDLYFRLAQFPIELPPLRERGDDVIELAEAFLEEFVVSGRSLSFTAEDHVLLREYPWHGNVRELRHVIQRAALLREPGSDRPALAEALANAPRLPGDGNGHDDGIVAGRTIAAVERDLIEATLTHFGGNKRKAAETLGISLKTLYNRLRDYREDREEPSG